MARQSSLFGVSLNQMLASQHRAFAGRHFRMARNKDETHAFSRRRFLRGMRWVPVLFLPAPMHAVEFCAASAKPGAAIPPFSFADVRLTPHYPAKSPLDEVLRLVVPGTDEYVTEKY